MNNNLTKWTNILKVAIATLGIILCLFLFAGPAASTATLSEIESFRDGGQMSAAIMFSIIILVTCLALIFFFFFRQLISNPKKTILSIIGIVVGLVLYLLFYAAGTSDTSEGLGLTKSIGEVSLGTIRSTTAGLYTVLSGLVIALLAIIITPFIGKLRK
jgi:drug/metabolite transporter (DMT)-like permease